MQECVEKHPACSLHSVDFLPTRLIDVGADFAPTIKITETKNLQGQGDCPKFAALSHCWGTDQPSVVLSSSNVGIFLNGMELVVLPRTFRDAIEIVRKLGIRYLWIDSLCIIQDDADDWQRESATMGAIYRVAHLTIAAASSTNSHGGCYITDPLPTMVKTLAIRLSDGTTQEFMMRLSQRPDTFTNSPLHQRAWVLQEAVLSRRTVFFTSDQMVWQCRTKVYREESKDVQPPSHDRFNLCMYNLQSGDPFGTWWSWVENYTSRKLTNPNDKLAAFAGITKMFQDETKYTPIAGLWKEHLLKDLLWTVYRSTYASIPKSEVTSIGAPSWSWASICEGKISRPETQHIQVSLVRQELNWSKEPLTSAILQARITLRGRVKAMKFHMKLVRPEETCNRWDHYSEAPFSHYSTSNPEYNWHLDRPLAKEGVCTLTDRHGTSDLYLDRAIPNGVEVLGLLMSNVSDKYETILLLAPTEVGKNEYRRLGVVKHSHLVMDVPTCRIHDRRIGHIEYCYPRNFDSSCGSTRYYCKKRCQATHMRHYPISCFAHAAECEVDIV